MKRARQIDRTAGQALLLAIIVMLMLALLAASVVAVVATSIDQGERDENRVRARLLAQAGLRYADEMLTESVEGANWRPTLAAYLDPDDAGFHQVSYDHHWDSFEKLRGWDPLNVRNRYAAGETPVYFVKYRFQQDTVAVSDDAVDGSQDFVPGFPNRPVENVELTVPHDHFLLRIEYDPDPSDPLSRYLKITSVGRPGLEPTAFEELVAYKPIGLMDYALFIHDSQRRAATQPLGRPWMDIDGDGQFDSNRDDYAGGGWATTGPNDFVPLTIEGPLRSNTAVTFHPPVRLAPVGSGWEGQAEIVGSAQVQPARGATGGNTEVLVEDAGGNFAAYDGSSSSFGQLEVGVDRIEVPALDSYDGVTGISRWDRLSRYSGELHAITDGTVTTQVDSGELGYGSGIYIDNEGQREPLDSVRNRWLQPETWGGRRYVPTGAIVELFAHYPDPLDTTLPPAIVVTRTDGSTFRDPLGGGASTGRRTMVYAFPDRNGTWNLRNPAAVDPNDATTWPQPDNGVIVAEGNVRVLGRLPASGSGLDYNLVIVSRGSIYIDGPLLRPSDYSDLADTDVGNTRIALLARDHVVVNPTMLAPGLVPGMPPAPFTTPADAPEDSYFALDAEGTRVLGLPVPINEKPNGAAAGSEAGDGGIRVTVIDADGNADDNLPAALAVQIAKSRSAIGVEPTDTSPGTATQPYLFSNRQPGRPGTYYSDATPALRSIGVPAFFADWRNLARALYPAASGASPLVMEYWPDSWGISADNFNSVRANSELGVPSYVTLEGGIDLAGAGGGLSRSDVIVKNAKVERLAGDDVSPRPGLEFVVSALMFAERGTFFVVPGDWFDPRANSPADVWDSAATDTITDANLAAAKYARLRRYNHRVTINGALSVNEMPSIMEVGESSNKWAYPTGGTGVALFNDYGSINYRYDWGLRDAVAGRPNQVRFPGLQASPGLLYAGEENLQ